MGEAVGVIPDLEEGQLVRIPIVQESEATGDLADLYEEVRETFGIGFVPDVFKLVAPALTSSVRCSPSIRQCSTVGYCLATSKS
jgi:hypothetical protein